LDSAVNRSRLLDRNGTTGASEGVPIAEKVANVRPSPESSPGAHVVLRTTVILMAVVLGLVGLGGCGKRATLSDADAALADSYWAARSASEKHTFCTTADGNQAMIDYWQSHLELPKGAPTSDQTALAEVRNRAADVTEYLKERC